VNPPFAASQQRQGKGLQAAKSGAPAGPSISPRKEPGNASIADLLAQLPGARKAAMPHEVYPMLATLVEEPFDDPQWIYEVKWDGYRAVAYLRNSEGKATLL